MYQNMRPFGVMSSGTERAYSVTPSTDANTSHRSNPNPSLVFNTILFSTRDWSKTHELCDIIPPNLSLDTEGVTELPQGDGEGSSFATMKKAHHYRGWAFCSVNDPVYFLDFFAFALAATFGLAAFAVIAMNNSPPPSAG